MNFFRKQKCIASGISLIVLAHGAALAQQSQDQAEDGTQEKKFETITVTAQKREQSLNDVPMSVTALTGDQLAARGVTDVQDLVKFTPGLSYVDSGGAAPVFSLRGVGFFDTAIGARPTVTVYQDEMPLPFSIMAQGASLDLERVEVLKGPQGTLFGQNSTGGTINYVAAKPTQDFQAGGAVSYGSYETVDATGYVNTPLGSGAALRVSGRVLEGGDWQRSYTRDADLGAKRFVQARALLELTPTERLTINLNVNGFTDKSDTQAGQLVGTVFQYPAFIDTAVPIVANYPVAPEDNRAADWGPIDDLRRDNEYYQASLRGDYEISDSLTLTSLTSYSEMEVDQKMDQDGTDQMATYTRVVGGVSSLSQEVRLSGDFGPAAFVIGGNYALDKSSQSDQFRLPYTTAANGTIPGYVLTSNNPEGRQRFETVAAFANADINLSDALVAHAGVRATNVVLDSAACTRISNVVGDEGEAVTFLINLIRSGSGLGPIPLLQDGECLSFDETFTPGRFKDTLDEDNVSWRVGLDWKPAPQTLVYANISRGFKSGSMSIISAAQQLQFAPVTQESVTAYEIGFKAPIVRGALDATGAVFYYDYKDKQLLGRRPVIIGVAPALVNVPESRVQGAEFQVNAYPVDGLTMFVAGTYLDTKVTSDFNDFSILSLPSNFKGDRFPYTPEWQFVGDVEYEFSLGDQLNAFVGANANYRSKTTAGFGSDPRLDIDGYTLVDARAGVRSDSGSWEASVFVRNLTDEYYWTNTARVSDIIRRLPGEPRFWGVRLSFQM